MIFMFIIQEATTTLHASATVPLTTAAVAEDQGTASSEKR